MRIAIIIPAHNEETFISETLDSLLGQSFPPQKILVVDDNSTDGTKTILKSYAQKHSSLSFITNPSKGGHEPGSKVIAAFNKGLEALEEEFDVICKFDADLIFPKDYLETVVNHFKNNPRCGMAGGFCYIQKKGEWTEEGLTNEDHLRGALKCYRQDCFVAIGGLRESMGWDTVDELLARFHGWEVHTDPSLKVKHLKITGAKYSKESRFKQGKAFRRMRYGFWLTLIASAKLAIKKQNLAYFLNCMQGFFKNGKVYIVSEEEGRFIRKLRWRKIVKKYSGKFTIR